MSFWHHPREAKTRRWLFLFHLWAGLIIGVFLTVVGLTGSLLVFNSEIRSHFEPHPVITSNTPKLAVMDLARIVNQRYPDSQISFVSLSSAAGEASTVSTDEPDTRRSGTVYLHPQTGAILAETIHHEAFLDWVYRVHIYLLAGETGYFFNGICSALAVVLCLSGLVIWWPGVKLWKRALLINYKARWKRKNYDLHRSIGFFAALFLAAVFLTGAYFRFPAPFVYVLSAVTGSHSRDLSLETPARNLPVIPAVLALSKGEAEVPNARTTSLGFARQDLHYFRVYRVLPDGQQRTVSVDAYTGRVLDVSSDQPQNLADRILGWSGPIHFGTWGGRVTQVLWVLLGITPGLLFITGILMYWNRVLSKRFRRLTRPQPERSSTPVHAA